MINITKDICSLTDFKRNSTQILDRVKKEKTPAILTVNGSASVVVLDAGTYQRLANDAQKGSIMRGIEAGLVSMKESRGIPAQKAFDTLRQGIRSQIKQQG